MAAQDRPFIGKWYQDAESGEAFEVLGVDEDASRVEVRYLNQGRRMLDFDAWQAIDPVRVKGPEQTPTDTARSPSAPPPGMGR